VKRVNKWIKGEIFLGREKEGKGKIWYMRTGLPQTPLNRLSLKSSPDRLKTKPRLGQL